MAIYKMSDILRGLLTWFKAGIFN